MVPVRVVLSNGEGDELDLGTFSQGVVIDQFDDMIDVATSERISYKIAVGPVKWYAMGGSRGYLRIFVHGVARNDRETIRSITDALRESGAVGVSTPLTTESLEKQVAVVEAASREGGGS